MSGCAIGVGSGWSLLSLEDLSKGLLVGEDRNRFDTADLHISQQVMRGAGILVGTLNSTGLKTEVAILELQ